MSDIRKLDFSSLYVFAPQEGKCIHPVKLLQLLSDCARILEQQTATPGMEQLPTEFLRGQRYLALTLANKLQKAYDNAPT